MERSSAPDLEEALAEVDRPKSHLLVEPPAGLVARIYSSPTFHRLLPAPLAVRLAELRGTLEFLLLSGRREAALAHAALLLETGDGTEIRRLARGLLQENAAQSELSWRPWLVRHARVEGLEPIDRAVAEGRPVVVGTLHFGSLVCLVQVLAYHGHPRFYISGGHPPSKPPWPGYLGRWVVAMNRSVEAAGGRWVYRGGSYPVLRALLERGSICLIGQDLRGDLPVPLFGRTTRLVRGPLNLARETGALYLPGVRLTAGQPPHGALPRADRHESRRHPLRGAPRRCDRGGAQASPPGSARAHRDHPPAGRGDLANRVLDRSPQHAGRRQGCLVPARQLDDLSALALGERRRCGRRAEDPVAGTQERQTACGPRGTGRRRGGSEERQRRAQRPGVAGEHGPGEALEPGPVELGGERVPGERLAQRALVADEIRLESHLVDGDPAPLRLPCGPCQQPSALQRGVEEHDVGDGSRQQPPEIGRDDRAERQADDGGRRVRLEHRHEVARIVLERGRRRRRRAAVAAQVGQDDVPALGEYCRGLAKEGAADREPVNQDDRVAAPAELLDLEPHLSIVARA